MYSNSQLREKTLKSSFDIAIEPAISLDKHLFAEPRPRKFITRSSKNANRDVQKEKEDEGQLTKDSPGASTKPGCSLASFPMLGRKNIGPSAMSEKTSRAEGDSGELGEPVDSARSLRCGAAKPSRFLSLQEGGEERGGDSPLNLGEGSKVRTLLPPPGRGRKQTVHPRRRHGPEELEFISLSLSSEGESGDEEWEEVQVPPVGTEVEPNPSLRLDTCLDFSALIRNIPELCQFIQSQEAKKTSEPQLTKERKGRDLRSNFLLLN